MSGQNTGGDPETQEAPAPAPEAPADDGIEELPEDEPVTLRTVRERNRELKALRERQREQDQELERLRQERMSEQERAVAAARQEGFQEAAQQYGRQLLEERVRGIATGELNDPDDALRYLPLDQMAEATREDIEQALLTLLEEKPYLAAKQPVSEQARGFVPFDGGPRGQGPPAKTSGEDFVRQVFKGHR
jgi:hypothetical protein